MMSLTSTSQSPWHVITANNKKFARIEVLKKAVEHFETLLDE